MITIIIPGPPVAKGRPKAVRMGKQGIRMYTPASTVVYENTCRQFAELAMAGKAPLEGPLAVRFKLYMPIPASLSKKKQVELVGQSHTKKPDASNIVKSIEDALNGVAWHDDSQIALLWAHKVYDPEPRAEVRVSPIDTEAA